MPPLLYLKMSLRIRNKFAVRPPTIRGLFTHRVSTFILVRLGFGAKGHKNRKLKTQNKVHKESSERYDKMKTPIKENYVEDKDATTALKPIQHFTRE